MIVIALLLGLAVGFAIGVFVGVFLADCRASVEPLDPELLEQLKRRVR